MKIRDLTILILAAFLEVGGDAVIRSGLGRNRVLMIAAGGLVLASYGLIINATELEFSRMMGLYIALFAIVSVIVGRLVFHESVNTPTLLGLALVTAGAILMQWGSRS